MASYTTWPSILVSSRPCSSERLFCWRIQRASSKMSVFDIKHRSYIGVIVILFVQGLIKTCTTLFWGRADRLPLNSTEELYDEESEESSEEAVELVRKSSVQPLTIKWVTDTSDGTGNLTANTNIAVSLQPDDPPVVFSWTVLSPTDVGGTLVVDVKVNQVFASVSSRCRETVKISRFAFF